MRSEGDIIERLKFIAQGRETVRFLNVYYGVPVTFSGRIVQVMPSSVMFAITRYQILCLKLDRRTYLECSALPALIKAEAMSLDPINELVTLANFECTDTRIGPRMQVRVNLPTPMASEIVKGELISGTIYEISAKGVGLLISAESYDPAGLEAGEKIRVRFRTPPLAATEEGIVADAIRAVADKTPVRYYKPAVQTGPEEGAMLSLEGIIRNVSFIKDKKLMRLGVQTFPDPKTEAIIAKYVNLRQTEILKQLKEHVELEDKIV